MVLKGVKVGDSENVTVFEVNSVCIRSRINSEENTVELAITNDPEIVYSTEEMEDDEVTPNIDLIIVGGVLNIRRLAYSLLERADELDEAWVGKLVQEMTVRNGEHNTDIHQS